MFGRDDVFGFSAAAGDRLQNIATNSDTVTKESNLYIERAMVKTNRE